MKGRRWLWSALPLGMAALALLVYYTAMPAYVRGWTAQMADDRFVGGSDSFRGAAFCKTCHPQHYEQWRQSLHSRAFTEAHFAVRAQELSWGMPEDRCLACHSPLARQGLAKEEGITCEVCHGPGMTRAVVPDICTRCHGQGMGGSEPSTTILSTPLEFEGSIAKGEGLGCKDCHLPRQGGMSLHAFPGSRAAPESYQGVVLVEDIERSGPTQVVVTVRNTVTGHWLPTGAETNVISLEVSAFEATRKAVGQREYRFEKSAFFFRTMPMRVTGDTRLRDGERRPLTFDLPASAARVRAVLRIKPRLWNGQFGDFVMDQKEAALVPAR